MFVLLAHFCILNAANHTGKGEAVGVKLSDASKELGKKVATRDFAVKVSYRLFPPVTIVYIFFP